jgi:hypothetical protein
MMRFLVARAVNPQLSLLDGLRDWNGIAAALREPPRQRRRYQGDDCRTSATSPRARLPPNPTQ